MTAKGWLVPLLLLGSIVPFLNGLTGPFQFDDYNVIVNNPVVHSWPAFFADTPHGIRPLLKFSYTLNWTIDPRPFGFHLFNLLVHALNVCLVYLLARRAFKSFSDVETAYASHGAFLAALLFAVHPVQTEAVTYICGRSVSLMTSFYLAGFLCYVRGREGGRPSSVLSPVFFLMALAVKETALTLPAALLLWELARPDRQSLKSIVRRQGVHWLILAGILVGLVLHPNYGWLLLFSIETRTLASNVLSQINGIGYLFTRMFRVLALNIDPDLPSLTRLTFPIVAEAVGLGALLGAGIISLRKWPLLAFGILWFFLHLMPTNSIIPRLDIANERQLYLASIGLFLPVAAGVVRLAARGGRSRTWSSALVAMMVVILVAGTVVRNEAYRSEISLWRDTAAKSPGKARVWNNLGYAYALERRYPEAREAYKKALRIKPEFSVARNNLADVEMMMKQEMMRQWGMGKVPVPLKETLISN